MKRQAAWNKLKEQMSGKRARNDVWGKKKNGSHLAVDSIRDVSVVEALEEKHENILQFRVEGEERPRTIEIELMMVTKSKYSNCSNILLLPDWKSAYEYRSKDHLNMDNKEYIPLLDSFLLSGATVNDTVYLRRNDCSKDVEVENQSTILYSLPNADMPTGSDPLIIYGPDLINGYQGDDFFLGVITNAHNKHGIMYTWFHNGNSIHNGYFLSLLRVDEPGTYYCKLSCNRIELVSSSVNIVIKAPNQNEETSCKYDGKFRDVVEKGESSTKVESDKGYPASVSIASLVNSGKLVIPHKKL